MRKTYRKLLMRLKKDTFSKSALACLCGIFLALWAMDIKNFPMTNKECYCVEIYELYVTLMRAAKMFILIRNGQTNLTENLQILEIILILQILKFLRCDNLQIHAKYCTTLSENSPKSHLLKFTFFVQIWNTAFFAIFVRRHIFADLQKFLR